ncbi:MAG: hypothetical protein ACM65L_02950 [Microcoleus sp.]
MLVFYLPQCYSTIIPYKLDVCTFFARRCTLMDVVGIKGDRTFCRQGRSLLFEPQMKVDGCGYIAT